MSRWHGPQGRGAARTLRATKRDEAEARADRAEALHRPRCPTTGKVRFTEDEARVELVGAVIKKNRGNNRRRERRAYQCEPGCGWWHLTSQEKNGAPA